MQLLSTVSRSLSQPNHWSGVWLECWRGLALLAADKEKEAVPLLTRSLVAAGQFDHTLTPLALLELGRLELRRGEFASASKTLLEASLSAAYFYDYGVLEESLRFGSLAYLMSNRKGVYPPLVPAVQWTHGSMRQLRVSLELSLAEHQAVRGLPQEAERGWKTRRG